MQLALRDRDSDSSRSKLKATLVCTGLFLVHVLQVDWNLCPGPVSVICLQLEFPSIIPDWASEVLHLQPPLPLLSLSLC